MPDKKKYKILIVDDVATNIKLLGEALKDDYRICVALNGPDALNIAQAENPPDLILLDIMMPGMDGHEVCKRLKANPETQDIPVIFATASNEEKDESLGLELGAVDFISKPFSMPIVNARIKAHLCTRDVIVKLKEKNENLEKLVADHAHEINRANMKIRMHDLLLAHEQDVTQEVSALAHELKNIADSINAHACRDLAEEVEKLAILPRGTKKDRENIVEELREATRAIINTKIT